MKKKNRQKSHSKFTPELLFKLKMVRQSIEEYSPEDENGPTYAEFKIDLLDAIDYMPFSDTETNDEVQSGEASNNKMPSEVVIKLKMLRKMVEEYSPEDENGQTYDEFKTDLLGMVEYITMQD